MLIAGILQKKTHIENKRNRTNVSFTREKRQQTFTFFPTKIDNVEAVIIEVKLIHVQLIHGACVFFYGPIFVVCLSFWTNKDVYVMMIGQ